MNEYKDIRKESTEGMKNEYIEIWRNAESTE